MMTFSKAIYTTLVRYFYLGLLALEPLHAASSGNLGITQLKPPHIITHRGGPLLWPEHTTEAYQASVNAGSHFVEVDCFGLKDGSLIIMHDGTLERTTTGKGLVEEQTARSMAAIQVDGERLLGSPWRRYRVPNFDEVLVRFGNQQIIFAEIKNALAASAVVEKLREYRIDPDFVVINAFSANNLKAARRAGYRTCLNLADEKLSPEQIVRMRHWAVGCSTSVSEAYVRALKRVGLMVYIFTPSNHVQRDEALAKGADGFYCDDPIYMSFSTEYRRNTDPFGRQTWYPGMLPGQPGGRGHFTAPDKWGINASLENLYLGCFQGWLSPIKDGAVAPEWSVELSVTFGVGMMDGRWASLGLFTDDRPFSTDTPRLGFRGYNFLFHNNGALSIYKYDGTNGGGPELLGNTPGRKVQVGATLKYRITVTPDQLMFECLDNASLLKVADPSFRGAFITLGAKGQKADFSKIKLSTY